MLGINGSVISDFFFQSVGLISYFIPITIIFSAINIFFKKTPSIIVNNIFLLANGSMPIGNGDTILTLWPNKTSSALEFYISKPDAMAR